MRVTLGLSTALLLACASAAEAQVRVHGRVIEDATERPIAGATVDLEDPRGRRLARNITDGLGFFSFEVGRRDAAQLRAGAPGYRRVTTPPFDMEGYTDVQLELRLDVEVVLLAPLEVVARSRSAVSPSLAGFERRREGGVIGSFITRDEIESRNPMRLSDMLERVPGVWMQQSRRSNRRVVYFSRSQSCPAQIFVDGFHMNRAVPGVRGRSMSESFPIDDVHPGSVEGIEVYQGLSRLPPEFVTPQAHCGVVAVWTRRG